MKSKFILITSLVFSTMPLLTGCATKCTLTIINNDPDMGEVSEGGVFKKGTKVAIKATPFETYYFDKWEFDYDKSSRATYTFIIEKNMTFYANFEHSTYSIDVTNRNQYDEFLGSLVDEENCEFQWGETTSLEVNSYSGYKVDKWIDNSNEEVLDEGNLFDIVMPTRDLSVRCTFTDNTLFFGNYPQDKVTDNDLINELKGVCQTDGTYFTYANENYYCFKSSYFFVSPLEWDIVEETDDYTLLITRNIVYGHKLTAADLTSYTGSDIRAYLTQEFYYDAFTESEKNQIQLRDIYVENNDVASDYVFLPYANSVDNYFNKYRVNYKYTYNTGLSNTLGISSSYSHGECEFIYHRGYDFENGSMVYDSVVHNSYCGYLCKGYTCGIRPMIQIKK